MDQQMEQKTKPLSKNDVFHVLSDEQLAKTHVVICDANKNSKLQKHRVFVVCPEEQIACPSPDALETLNDLKGITNAEYPKLKVTLPPFRLLSKQSKLAGPGANPVAKKGEVENVANFTHSFWIVASTEGVPEEVLKRYGGAAALREKQLSAIERVKNAAVVFERKRFFHPEMKPDKVTIEKKMKLWRKHSPNITEKEMMEAEFEQAVDDHDILKIISNLKPSTNGKNTDPGISLTSKAWYLPKNKPTEIENETLIKKYHADAKKYNFSVNSQIIEAIQSGLRHRRVPVFALQKRSFQYMEGPIDPMKFHACAGDLVICDIEYNMYDATTRGGTWSMSKIKIVHQATKEASLSIEAEEDLWDLPDVVDRFATPALKEEKENCDQEDEIHAAKRIKCENFQPNMPSAMDDDSFQKEQAEGYESEHDQ